MSRPCHACGAPAGDLAALCGACAGSLRAAVDLTPAEVRAELNGWRARWEADGVRFVRLARRGGALAHMSRGDGRTLCEAEAGDGETDALLPCATCIAVARGAFPTVRP